MEEMRPKHESNEWKEWPVSKDKRPDLEPALNTPEIAPLPTRPDLSIIDGALERYVGDDTEDENPIEKPPTLH